MRKNIQNNIMIITIIIIIFFFPITPYTQSLGVKVLPFIFAYTNLWKIGALNTDLKQSTKRVCLSSFNSVNLEPNINVQSSILNIYKSWRLLYTLSNLKSSLWYKSSKYMEKQLKKYFSRFSWEQTKILQQKWQKQSCSYHIPTSADYF